MQELGIFHIADSLIGHELARGISGGERRRLSIATELVTDPAILYLDEVCIVYVLLWLCGGCEFQYFAVYLCCAFVCV